MIDKFKYAKLLIIFFECLNFALKFIKINKNKPNNVKIAGYILNEPKKSPWISIKKERWNPQPKHSIPKMVLLKQGNM